MGLQKAVVVAVHLRSKGHGESTLDAKASTNQWAPPASFIIAGGRETEGLRLLPVSPPPRSDTMTAAF